MALAPWKIRVTADGAGTLGAVHATVELVDRAAGCRLPPGPWQHFEPESVDAVYSDGDPAFWLDTSGNDRHIDGVIITSFGDPGVPAPYRPNLLNGYGGITLTGADFDAGYDAGTYYYDRDGADDPWLPQTVGDDISLVMVVNTSSAEYAALWNPSEGGNTLWTLESDYGTLNFAVNNGAGGSVLLSDPAPGGWAIVSASVNASRSTMWVNGVEVATGAGVSGPWDHVWSLYYGGAGVTEYIIYAFDIGDAGHADVWCALGPKYALS